jgi:hypothetical protein
MRSTLVATSLTGLPFVVACPGPDPTSSDLEVLAVVQSDIHCSSECRHT